MVHFTKIWKLLTSKTLEHHTINCYFFPMENADVKKNKTLIHFHSLSVFHFIWQRTHLLSGSNEAVLLGLKIH